MQYDVAVIGGGIAGLQAAIQLGRYNHDVVVFDSEDSGRSNLCRCYHNMLGWPNGVSGQHLRDIGTNQAKELGVTFVDATVNQVVNVEEVFQILTNNRDYYQARKVLFATGVKDRLPSFPDLYPCLGNSVYICPDCDGHEIKDKKTIVMGSGKSGAGMALTLTYFSNEIVYVNDEKEEIGSELLTKLKNKGITYYEAAIKEFNADNGQFLGVLLEDGTNLEARHGFVSFGCNEVNSGLAKELGVDLHKNNHILVNPRTQMTSVENVWAAGDVVAHSEQVTIAMGDGMQAAIWMHKMLLKEQEHLD